MAAPYELVPVPLTGGVDEGTDSLSIEPGSFARVENARFDKASRISKRFGFERAAAAPGGDAWGHTTVMGALGDAVVAASVDGLREWSEALGATVDGGGVPNARVRRSWYHFSSEAALSPASQVETRDGYTVYCVADPTTGSRTWIVDDATGVVVSRGAALSHVGTAVEMSSHPGRVCVAIADTATGDVHVQQWTLATMTVLSVTFPALTLGAARVVGDGSNWYLAYASLAAGEVTIDRLDTALAVADTHTFAGTDAVTVDAVVVGARLFAVWSDITAATIEDAVLDIPGLAVYRAPTPIAGWATGGPVLAGTDGANAVYSRGVGAVLVSTADTDWKVITAAGVVVGSDSVGGVTPVSRPFVAGGAVTQWVIQATSDAGEGGTLLWLAVGVVPPTRVLGTALYGVAAPYPQASSVSARGNGEHVLRVTGMTEPRGTTGFAPALAIVTCSRGVSDLGPPVVVGGDLMYPDGVPWLWAPAWSFGPTHAQWVHSPKMSATGVAGAGLLTPLGVYRYVLVYEGRSPRGGRMRSVVSATATVTLGAGENSADLLLAHATATTFAGGVFGAGATLEVYRTVANATADAPFYRLAPVSEVGPTNNRGATAPYAMTDLLSDAALVSHPQLYITGGELDNEPIWGGASSLAVHADRVFACGGEDPEVVWYSKTLIAGEVASFSSALQLRFAGEDCVAVASLDDVLVVFTRTAIYGVSGYGPNNTGSTQSGGYQQFLITADTGCKSARALVRVPGGIIFHGAGGLRLLTRARAIELIGQPVQDLIGDSAVVLWAITVPDVTEARFGIFDSASEQYRVVVLDYSSMRWTVHRHGYEPETTEPWAPTTLAPVAAVYSPTHGVLMAGKCLALETRDGFADPGAGARGAWYGLEIETPQLALSPGGQSWKRLRAVHLTGLYRDRHGLRVRISTDGGAPEDHEWTASAIAAEFAIAGQERVTVGVARQLGTWYSVVVSETHETDTVDTEGVTLRGLALHVAQRPGAGRDPLGARR